MATFLRAISRTPPSKVAPDESTLVYTTSSASGSESESEGVDSSLPRESERPSPLADPLAGPSSVGRRGRLADPPRVASSLLPKLGLATQAKVSATPASLVVVAACLETPRVIQDLRAELKAPVEANNVPDGCVGTLQAVQGRKAKLDAAVAWLTCRQARFDQEVLVEQMAAAALEGSRNPAAMLALLLLDLTAKGSAPPTLPPPSPAPEGLVMMESEEEEE
ncbi:MAG: hypothetical protein M1840_001523 [Geoglossum simile]|nr:MAG: hypothetical protein M1840_001523 [Geoglossum simile]